MKVARKKQKQKLNGSIIWECIWGLQKQYLVPVKVVGWGFDKKDAVGRIIDRLCWIKKPTRKDIEKMIRRTKVLKRNNLPRTRRR